MGKQKIDFGLIIRANKAARGDIVAICELINYYLIYDDWVAALEYHELLVDFEPSIVEKKYKEVTGYDTTYETFLMAIGKTYFELDDYASCYRWYQKCLDYYEYGLRQSGRDKRYITVMKKHTPIYLFIEKEKQLNNIKNRFLLKWEQDLFYGMM